MGTDLLLTKDPSLSTSESDPARKTTDWGRKMTDPARKTTDWGRKMTDPARKTTVPEKTSFRSNN